MFPRICTVCEVYVKEMGRTIRVFNTHFDHICAPARNLSVKIILETMHRLNARQKLPTILMGDMNATPSSRPIRMLTDAYLIHKDIHLTCAGPQGDANSPACTYHGFHGKASNRRLIDYIFVSEEFDVERAYVDTSNDNGRFPSDHYPLVAELRLKEEGTVAANAEKHLTSEGFMVK